MVDAHPSFFGSGVQDPVDPIDHLILRVDGLIRDASKIDPVSTALLGLAKAELVKSKALKVGAIAPFRPPADPR